MPPNDFRVVLDTNIVVRAFISMRSDSGRIFKMCEQRFVVPLLSSELLEEYRYILADPKLVERYPEVSRPEVGVAFERLTYVSDNLRGIRTRFAYPRDPKDAHLIELANAGRATHLISTDKDCSV